eukprot:364277-Chlamydomonas_euryale.AAC.5
MGDSSRGSKVWGGEAGVRSGGYCAQALRLEGWGLVGAQCCGFKPLGLRRVPLGPLRVLEAHLVHGWSKRPSCASQGPRGPLGPLSLTSLLDFLASWEVSCHVRCPPPPFPPPQATPPSPFGALGDEVLCIAGDELPRGVCKAERLVQDRVKDLLLVGAIKRRVPSQRNKQYDAQAPHVALYAIADLFKDLHKREQGRRAGGAGVWDGGSDAESNQSHHAKAACVTLSTVAGLVGDLRRCHTSGATPWASYQAPLLPELMASQVPHPGRHILPRTSGAT